MASAARRSTSDPARATPRTTETQWTKHKDEIIRLYLYEKKSLMRLREIMKEYHGFDATEKMFKDRIAKWKVHKNLREGDALQMARVKSRREAEGKGSEFWRYGKYISSTYLERYLREHPHIVATLKKKIPEDILMRGHIEALLPPHIVVLTPCQALHPGDQLYTMEMILFTYQQYLESTFPDQDENLKPHAFAIYGTELLDAIAGRHAHDSSVSEDRVLNAALLQRCFNNLRNTVKNEYPTLLFGLTATYLLAEKWHFGALGRLWLSQARDLSSLYRGSSHPLPQTLSGIIILQTQSNRIHESELIDSIARLMIANIPDRYPEKDQFIRIVQQFRDCSAFQVSEQKPHESTWQLPQHIDAVIDKPELQAAFSIEELFSMATICVSHDRWYEAIQLLETCRHRSRMALSPRRFLAELYLGLGHIRRCLNICLEMGLIWSFLITSGHYQETIACGGGLMSVLVTMKGRTDLLETLPDREEVEVFVDNMLQMIRMSRIDDTNLELDDN